MTSRRIKFLPQQLHRGGHHLLVLLLDGPLQSAQLGQDLLQLLAHLAQGLRGGLLEGGQLAPPALRVVRGAAPPREVRSLVVLEERLLRGGGGPGLEHEEVLGCFAGEDEDAVVLVELGLAAGVGVGVAVVAVAAPVESDGEDVALEREVGEDFPEGAADEVLGDCDLPEPGAGEEGQFAGEEGAEEGGVWVPAGDDEFEDGDDVLVEVGLREEGVDGGRDVDLPRGEERGHVVAGPAALVGVVREQELDARRVRDLDEHLHPPVYLLYRLVHEDQLRVLVLRGRQDHRLARPRDPRPRQVRPLQRAAPHELHQREPPQLGLHLGVRLLQAQHHYRLELNQLARAQDADEVDQVLVHAADNHLPFEAAEFGPARGSSLGGGLGLAEEHLLGGLRLGLLVAVGGDLFRLLLVLADDIDVGPEASLVPDLEGAGVQADDVVSGDAVLHPDDDGALLAEHRGGHFREGAVAEAGGEGDAVDFVGLAAGVLRGPVREGVVVHRGGDEVEDETDDAGAEAALGEQVHFELLDGQDVVAGGVRHGAEVVRPVLRAGQLHRHPDVALARVVHELLDREGHQDGAVVVGLALRGVLAGHYHDLRGLAHPAALEVRVLEGTALEVEEVAGVLGTVEEGLHFCVGDGLVEDEDVGLGGAVVGVEEFAGEVEEGGDVEVPADEDVGRGGGLVAHPGVVGLDGEQVDEFVGLVRDDDEDRDDHHHQEALPRHRLRLDVPVPHRPHYHEHEVHHPLQRHHLPSVVEVLSECVGLHAVHHARGHQHEGHHRQEYQEQLPVHAEEHAVRAVEVVPLVHDLRHVYHPQAPAYPQHRPPVPPERQHQRTDRAQLHQREDAPEEQQRVLVRGHPQQEEGPVDRQQNQVHPEVHPRRHQAVAVEHEHHVAQTAHRPDQQVEHQGPRLGEQPVQPLGHRPAPSPAPLAPPRLLALLGRQQVAARNTHYQSQVLRGTGLCRACLGQVLPQPRQRHQGEAEGVHWVLQVEHAPVSRADHAPVEPGAVLPLLLPQVRQSRRNRLLHPLRPPYLAQSKQYPGCLRGSRDPLAPPLRVRVGEDGLAPAPVRVLPLQHELDCLPHPVLGQVLADRGQPRQHCPEGIQVVDPPATLPAPFRLLAIAQVLQHPLHCLLVLRMQSGAPYRLQKVTDNIRAGGVEYFCALVYFGEPEGQSKEEVLSVVLVLVEGRHPPVRIQHRDHELHRLLYLGLVPSSELAHQQHQHRGVIQVRRILEVQAVGDAAIRLDPILNHVVDGSRNVVLDSTLRKCPGCQDAVPPPPVVQTAEVGDSAVEVVHLCEAERLVLVRLVVGCVIVWLVPELIVLKGQQREQGRHGVGPERAEVAAQFGQLLQDEPNPGSSLLLGGQGDWRLGAGQRGGEELLETVVSGEPDLVVAEVGQAEEMRVDPLRHVVLNVGEAVEPVPFKEEEGDVGQVLPGVLPVGRQFEFGHNLGGLEPSPPKDEGLRPGQRLLGAAGLPQKPVVENGRVQVPSLNIGLYYLAPTAVLLLLLQQLPGEQPHVELAALEQSQRAQLEVVLAEEEGAKVGGEVPEGLLLPLAEEGLLRPGNDIADPAGGEGALPEQYQHNNIMQRH